MLFLAQINLTDLEKLDNLPEKGLLQFFVANDDMFGLENPVLIKYIEDYDTKHHKILVNNMVYHKFISIKFKFYVF